MITDSKKNNNANSRFWLNLSVFIMLYISQETLIFGTNESQIYLYAQYAILFVLFIFMALSLNKGIQINKILVVIVLIFLSLMSAIVNADLNNKYFYEFFLLVFALIFTTKYSLKDFIESFSLIIYILAILSWVTYLISIFGMPVQSFFPIIVNKAGTRFYNLFIGVIPLNENWVNVYRNYGIFREPGVYQIFLNLALMFLLNRKQDGYFANKKKYFMAVIVLTLTVISTLSTAGFFILALNFLIFILNNNKANNLSNFSKFFISIIILIVIVFVVVGNDYINEMIFSKLYSNNNSLLARVSSFRKNFIVFLRHPIFGAGLDGVKEEFANVSLEYYNNLELNNTNTILKELAVHGLFFIVLWLIGFYRFFKNSFGDKLVFNLCFLSMFISLSNEDLTLNIILAIMVLFGFGSCKNVRKEGFSYVTNS